MKILGIETSCDETAAAVVEDGRKIISNIVASSSDLHQKTGGIIPEIAAREQVKYIIPVIDETMRQLTMKGIDALAVTVGPGLIGSLLVGVETAKTIAFVNGKPIIPVNHIFAHIYANWLHPGQVPEFPAIALIVSGGHTDLFLMQNHNDIKWLGGTRDDAAGEAFDKTARLLGLGYPGGPAIAAAAAKYQISNIKYQIRLPRPMINEDNFDFSFSGLKTAVMREVNKLKAIKQPALPCLALPCRQAGGRQAAGRFNNLTTCLAGRRVQQLAFEIQESITDVLVSKTLKACNKFRVKFLLLGGGVAANKRLTEKFQLKISNFKLKISLYVPPSSLCTDNAAYIASCAHFNYNPVSWKDVYAQPDLSVEV